MAAHRMQACRGRCSRWGGAPLGEGATAGWGGHRWVGGDEDCGGSKSGWSLFVDSEVWLMMVVNLVGDGKQRCCWTLDSSPLLQAAPLLLTPPHSSSLLQAAPLLLALPHSSSLLQTVCF